MFYFCTEINTLEGLIDGIKQGLEQDQPVRRALDPDTAGKIDAFIERLVKLKDVEQPFQVVSVFLLKFSLVISVTK